ncbi:uncharacterized protein LOC108849949 [Raphanus sativus]|uniref:Uncharacterized protein LOC108849949 n=1 Tax=Raphanus sativus TaxID=3726 RepID=A0A6J0N536_RAPSA|nr:uncharacterized protein LOC108849949 [Raphanus sativus]
MTFALKYLVIFLLLSMVTQGLCGCSFANIQIGGARTGRVISGEPEWKISVINTCSQPQSIVILSCGGFAPVKPVDPSLLVPKKNTCLLINGNAIPAGGTVQFTYAGEPYFFKPISSRVG